MAHADGPGGLGPSSWSGVSWRWGVALGLGGIVAASVWFLSRPSRHHDARKGAHTTAHRPAAPPAELEDGAVPVGETTSRTTLFDAVGNTPLLHIESLSDATGCTILAKAEFMNPGGSVKDRVARNMIIEAEREGKIRPGVSKLIEATAGSTGISLALLGRARGYDVELYLPDNVSSEKVALLTTLGAKIQIVPIMPMSQPEHFMHYAMSKSMAEPNSYYCNQFDNLANMRAHYTSTGPEIWNQTGGRVDGIVMGAGTGGTIAGITKYLKEKNPKLVSYLIDPPGSGLYNLINKGVMFDPQDTMTVEPLSARSFYEGIGVNRQTENFSQVERYDGAFRGSEQEGVEMAHYLLRHEGLFVGGSSALNCVGAVKLARKLGPGHTIVTVLCDSGQRYHSRMYNQEWLEERELRASARDRDDLSFIEEP